MRVVTPNGREVVWNLKGFQVRGDDSTPRSNLHLRARRLLKETHPLDVVLEEVPVPGTRLKADFLVPSALLMIEVQGRQHFEHSAHFHGSIGGFLAAKARDRSKAEFCRVNKITLVELRFDESDDEWRRKLLDA